MHSKLVKLNSCIHEEYVLVELYRFLSIWIDLLLASSVASKNCFEAI
ncbi:MAG: hypothetical protein PQ968_00415 [Methanobacterium sp.]